MGSRHVAITAHNGSDGKWEVLLTLCVGPTAVLTVPFPL